PTAGSIACLHLKTRFPVINCSVMSWMLSSTSRPRTKLDAGGGGGLAGVSGAPFLARIAQMSVYAIHNEQPSSAKTVGSKLQRGVVTCSSNIQLSRVGSLYLIRRRTCRLALFVVCCVK